MGFDVFRMTGVGQVLSSLEGHAHALDSELRQVEADLELNRIMERKYGDLFQPGINHLQKLGRTREDKLNKVIGQVEGWKVNISHGKDLLDTLDGDDFAEQRTDSREFGLSQSHYRSAHGSPSAGHTNVSAVNVHRSVGPGRSIMQDHQDAVGPFRVSTNSPILVNSPRVAARGIL